MCAEDNLRTIEQLQSERAEQARLLDAGGERELALMARIDALEAARFAYASEFRRTRMATLTLAASTRTFGR